MAHELLRALLALTGLLGVVLVTGVLREKPNPTWLRRLHLAAGASTLTALVLAIRAAAGVVPPLAGPTGQLPAAFVASALVLGLLLSLVVRFWRQGFTIVVALHVCMGFCGVLLAAAWVLRPGG